MKRYIEIVYDNSGSMNDFLGSRRKYEVALELFEREILPTIGLPGDQVILRLLGSGCSKAASSGELLPNDRNAMLKRIMRIQHDRSTPLFYTVSDAVEACKRVEADEHLVFVFTDGDDTCSVRIEDVIDEDTQNRYVRFYKVLLVQLAIESPISRNNLTAFTTALGGQAISLDREDSVTHMRNKLRSALNVSGFSSVFPLEHCFDTLGGPERTWEEIERGGISLHQARLLYNKGWLSWMPDTGMTVTPLQYAELNFLISLAFKTGLPDDLTKSMLSQLKQPYYYSFDCIYWDFGRAQWRYFVPHSKIEQLPNPENDYAEVSKGTLFEEWTDRQYYGEDEIYQVEMGHTVMPSFQLEHYSPKDLKTQTRKSRVKILRPGDKIRFRR